jgi:2-phosphosulfolactate phosphatase
VRDADPIFGQAPYRRRLEWGRQGARRAAERGDALVVVDTLSFSTAVATAVARGGVIYPCADDEDAAAVAARVGGEAAVGRREVPARGRFSLSPPTFLAIRPGEKVALRSPNGATCARYAEMAPALFAGALVNASAVAAAAERVCGESARAVTVVACGERWPDSGEDGALRFAIEDYLGAGAILAALGGPASPEAQVCVAAFLGARADLAGILWECASGRELRAQGFGEDVRHAAALDCYDSAPLLRDGAFRAAP